MSNCLPYFMDPALCGAVFQALPPALTSPGRAYDAARVEIRLAVLEVDRDCSSCLALVGPRTRVPEEKLFFGSCCVDGCRRIDDYRACCFTTGDGSSSPSWLSSAHRVDSLAGHCVRS